MVWILARTPTAARLAWITVPISTGDCMPEPDSGHEEGHVEAVGVAGLLQERLGLLGIVRDTAASCPRGTAPYTGESGLVATIAVPFRMSRMIASLFTA